MEPIIATVWSFCISFLAIRLSKPIAIRTGLVDKPNERKHHVGSIPLVGGIAIFFGVVTSIKMFLPYEHSINVYLTSASIILLLGVLDDKHDLKVSYRMAVQAASALILILGNGLYLESLGGILFVENIHLGHIGVLVTIAAVIGAINAFNMVDGIDGLAGMLSITSLLGLAILMLLGGGELWLIPFVYISAILAYLCFNLGWPFRKVKKIFMGDAGSMLIGLTVVWLLVLGSQSDEPQFRPVTALWIIALPLMDMAAIMLRRIKKGQSPFKPDRDHLHHICMRAGLSPMQALLFITLVSGILVFIGVISEIYKVNETMMFLSFILVFVFYDRLISNVWRVITWIRKRNL